MSSNVCGWTVQNFDPGMKCWQALLALELKFVCIKYDIRILKRIASRSGKISNPINERMSNKSMDTPIYCC